MIGIYCIENTASGRKYVGQSVEVEKRFRNHKSELKGNRHRNVHLQRAWNKYGEASFRMFALCECAEADLDQREVYYMQEFASRGELYNLKDGGANGRHSEESKRKTSLAKTGNKNRKGSA
jgi:group I intron endonuclease